MTYKLRKPDKKELGDLKQYLLDTGQDTETAEIIVNSHFFGVIDDYISDCPAYTGKLMFAVYGMPEFYEVFIWENDKLSRVELDDGFLYSVRKRYLKNLTEEELAEEFDRTLDTFRERHNININKIEELAIGWIDYKYSEMGRLEKAIKDTIVKVFTKGIKK